MTAVRVLFLVLACAFARAEAPEEKFAQGARLFDAGSFEAAEEVFAQFRRDYPGHQLYWFAGMNWAKCATDPEEAERRLREVAAAEKAPAEVRTDCELELANLALMRDAFDEAEKQFGAWTAAHPADERGESARFWRALALRELGREKEAADEWAALQSSGRQEAWRALAGLQVAALKFGAGDMKGARAAYKGLAEAPWARDIRPQALLGLANSAATAGERAAALKKLRKDFPDSPEAEEAGAAPAVKSVGGKRPVRPRWGVQIGAYSRKANADAARRQWIKKGRPAAIATRKLGQLTLHAVVLGPFASRETADREARALKAQGVPALATTY